MCSMYINVETIDLIKVLQRAIAAYDVAQSAYQRVEPWRAKAFPPAT
jgi:hypothetical protein